MISRFFLALLTSSQVYAVQKFDFDNARLSMADRWQSMMAYVSEKGTAATQILLAKAKDKVWYMRNAALVALDDINSPHALDVAKKLLNDESLVVRSAAVNVLQKHLSQEVRQLLWKELELKRNFLKSQSLWIRAQIMEILSSQPLNSELKYFRQFKNDADQKVAHAAKRAMDLISEREPNHLAR